MESSCLTFQSESLCHFIEIGHQTDQKHISHTHPSLSRISLVVQARGSPVALCPIADWKKAIREAQASTESRLVEMFGTDTFGSRTGEKSGWRLPPAGRRLLLIRVSATSSTPVEML